MRSAPLAGLVLALVPALGSAQTGHHYATVTDDGVKLRAGPSDRLPVTGSLPKGAAVVVHREEPNGWLAVQDDLGKGVMHSVSWVQLQFVRFETGKPIPQNVVVTEETNLRPGQTDDARPLPNVQGVKVPAGTTLTVIGPKVTVDGKASWYPVIPPAGDFRYVPKTAVKDERPVEQFVVRDKVPAPAPAASIPGPGAGGSLPPPPAAPATAASKPAVQHPLWAQAEAAEHDGRLDDAEKLFFQLAREMNDRGGDHDVANMCYTRIHSLREKKRAGSATNTVATAAATTSRPALGPPSRPVGSSAPPPAAEPTDSRARWIGPGRLMTSGVALNGQKTYSLVSSAGETMVYVVPGQGVALDKYVGKRVEVYGVSGPFPKLSKPYVEATAVEPKP